MENYNTIEKLQNIFDTDLDFNPFNYLPYPSSLEKLYQYGTTYKFFISDSNAFFGWKTKAEIPFSEHDNYESWITFDSAIFKKSEAFYAIVDEFLWAHMLYCSDKEGDNKIIPENIRYRFSTMTDNKNKPVMRWLLKGIFPMNSIISIFGESGTGKSFLAVDFALRLSSGYSEWFGRKIKKVPVLYICMEGELGFINRLELWKTKFGEGKQISDFYYIFDSFNLNTCEDIQAIIASILFYKAHNGLVIIDTLSCASSGLDENTSEGMGIVLASARKIKDATGSSVLFVHHTGKEHDKGPRGHSSFRGNQDGILEAKSTKEGNFLKIFKSKDGRTGDEFEYDLETLSLGIVDEDNEDITSCVVNYLPEKKQVRYDKLGLTPALVNAFEQIQKYILLNGERREGIDMVPYEDCVKHIGNLFTDNSRHVNTRGKEKISALLKDNLVCIDPIKKWLWIV